MQVFLIFLLINFRPYNASYRFILLLEKILKSKSEVFSIV